jgi:hypothetical protein
VALRSRYNRRDNQGVSVAGKKFEGELAEYDDNYLRCRGRRNHPWQFQTDFNVTTNVRGRIVEFVQIMHCAVCTTNRMDTYEVTKTGRFKLKGRRYEYADGYQLHAHGKVALDEARDELLMRELSQSLASELEHRQMFQKLLAQREPKAKGPVQRLLRVVS